MCVCMCVGPALLSPHWQLIKGITPISLALSSQHRGSGREILVELRWVGEERSISHKIYGKIQYENKILDKMLCQ